MIGTRWWGRLLRGGAVGAIAAWLAWAAMATIAALHNQPAVADSAAEFSRADVLPAVPRSVIPPADDALWRPVNLPHRWSTTHPGFQGGSMWYRFLVDLRPAPAKPWAVYIPRAVMNARIWVNGMPMQDTGSMEPPVARQWYVPVWSVPLEEHWREGVNVIHVQVAHGVASRNGLSAVYVGPVSELAVSHQLRVWAQRDGIVITGNALIVLGLFVVLAWTRDRTQTAIGFMGLSSVFWGLGSTMMISPEPPMDPNLWGVLAHLSAVWGQLLMCLFFFRFSGWERSWMDALVYGLMLAVPACNILVASFALNAFMFAAVYALAVWGSVTAISHVVRTHRRDGWLLVLGCMVLLPVGAHDVLVQLDQLPFDAVYGMPYVGPLMLVCIFVILTGDYSRSRRALAAMNLDLADRVAQRERELIVTFERMAALEQAQAVSAERSRILQDMHDGVGAHLTSALRQLQSPRAQVNVPMVAQAVRDSLDHLKLSIDALSLAPGDIAGLLASWRFRLTPRLRAAGLDLVWEVDDLPPWPQGQPPALRQLQYILFEGLSNVLQHSGATRVSLTARVMGNDLRISLTDNGRGWAQVGETPGQGLASMRGRAGVIGATINFLAHPEGGAEVRLCLPLGAPTALSYAS